MDTRQSKLMNKNFRPDPAIAFFDALAANTSETHIMKLPKVPNTKGKYLAQYVDTSGTTKVGYCFGPGEDHFVVYRVTPYGVTRYFFECNTTNFKNTNSRNHYLTGDLGDIYKTILAYRKNLKWDSDSGVFVLTKFKTNLDRLIEKKKDTTSTLRAAITAITGKVCVGFDFEMGNCYDDQRMAQGTKYLNQLRSWISDMGYRNLIRYK
jgi:hypothetical protein